MQSTRHSRFPLRTRYDDLDDEESRKYYRLMNGHPEFQLILDLKQASEAFGDLTEEELEYNDRKFRERAQILFLKLNHAKFDEIILQEVVGFDMEVLVRLVHVVEEFTKDMQPLYEECGGAAFVGFEHGEGMKVRGLLTQIIEEMVYVSTGLKPEKKSNEDLMGPIGIGIQPASVMICPHTNKFLGGKDILGVYRCKGRFEGLPRFLPNEVGERWEHPVGGECNESESLRSWEEM